MSRQFVKLTATMGMACTTPYWQETFEVNLARGSEKVRYTGGRIGGSSR
jgi:hypothetical protein